MRPITVYGVRNNENYSIHEVTMNFNKEGILKALNDALDYGNPNYYDDGTITLEYYPTKEQAEGEQKSRRGLWTKRLGVQHIISQVSPEAD